MPRKPSAETQLRTLKSELKASERHVHLAAIFHDRMLGAIDRLRKFTVVSRAAMSADDTRRDLLELLVNEMAEIVRLGRK